MNQQPDKLFRDKLYNYQRPASADAWSKVDAQLNKKKDKLLWLKIAAAILLLAVAAFVLWPHSDASTQVAEKANIEKTEPQKEGSSNPLVEKEKVEVTNQEIPEKSIARVDQTEQKVESVDKKKTSNKKTSPVKLDKNEAKIPSPHIAPIEKTESVAQIEKSATTPEKHSIVVHEENANTIAMTEENTSTESEGVTLVYSAHEVNEKYLNKKSMAEATPEKKKPSTLRKLLDKAYDLKHNQDPFGDLRQKKNEILALNFKNEKQRSQNK